MAQGRPDTAIVLESGALKLAEAKRENSRKLISEGAMNVANAARSGDSQAVMIDMNKQGDYKLTEPPVDGKILRDLGPLGKQATYEYDVSIVGKNGKVTSKPSTRTT